MNTIIVNAEEGIELGAEIIKGGGVVAFPTETVYGLGANALCEKAVEKIFIAKGRPQDNPLIVHIASINEIDKLACEIPPIAYKLAAKFMPGPFTMVLKKKNSIPDNVTAGLKTVGIRMPNNDIALRFIEACGTPIAAPSANYSTHVSPTQAEHVYNDLRGKIPLIIDGGSSDVGIESTVVDLTGDTIRILRPGAVTAKMIEDVVGVSIESKYIYKGIPTSPGMKYRHYAPLKPIKILSSRDEIIEEYDKLLMSMKPVIITSRPIDYGNRSVIDVGGTIQLIAKNIYDTLRYCEKNYDYILCEDFDSGDYSIGHSIMNRLRKASER